MLGVLAIDGRMISLIELESLMPAQAERRRDAPSDRHNRNAAGELLFPGEFKMSHRDFRRIAPMLYTDAGIYLPETKATLVYSRLAKRLRKLELESFQRLLRSRGRPEGAAERRRCCRR